MTRWLVLWMLLVLATGCKAFDASLLDGPDAMAPSCALRRPPVRPDVADGDDGETYFFAARDVRIVQADGVWAQTGYDLDGICSEGEAPRVECLSFAGAPPEMDGEGGIDNSIGHNVLPVAVAVRDDFLARATSGQTQGLGAIMIRIRGWNGAANDPTVEAVFMQTVFGSAEELTGPIGEVDVSDGFLRIDGVPHPIPEWDGGDWFYVQEAAFLDGSLSRPRLVDDQAFVADDVLVMRLPDRFPFYLGGDESGVNFALTDVEFTVRFSADHERVEEAVLAGRWGILDLLAGLAPTGICPDSPDYDAFTRLLTLSADVRSIPNSGGPGALCDAVSLGLAFDDGARVNMGGLHPSLPLPDPCSATMDAGIDASPLDAGSDIKAPMDGGSTG